MNSNYFPTEHQAAGICKEIRKVGIEVLNVI
jgi:hypothetical protein